MSEIKHYRMFVNLGAAQTRKRLKGVGYGVRKVEVVDRGQSLIVHTATGDHRRALYAIFAGLIYQTSDNDHPGAKQVADAASQHDVEGENPRPGPDPFSTTNDHETP